MARSTRKSLFPTILMVHPVYIAHAGYRAVKFLVSGYRAGSSIADLDASPSRRIRIWSGSVPPARRCSGISHGAPTQAAPPGTRPGADTAMGIDDDVVHQRSWRRSRCGCLLEAFLFIFSEFAHIIAIRYQVFLTGYIEHARTEVNSLVGDASAASLSIAPLMTVVFPTREPLSDDFLPIFITSIGITTQCKIHPCSEE